MDKHPSYNVEESAGKEGDPVAKVVYHQTASEISGDISAPDAGAQQTQCGAVPFFGGRCHEQCLRRIDRTGEEGCEEADAQEPPEVAGKGEKGIEDSSRVTGAEQHDFASVFIRHHSPEWVGNGQAEHPCQGIDGYVEPPEMFAVDMQVVFQEQRNEGHAASEADHGQKLRKEDDE